MWGNYAHAMPLLYLLCSNMFIYHFAEEHQRMDLFFLPGTSLTLRKDPTYFLAFSWVVGLLSGMIISLGHYPTTASLMRLAPTAQVSIVSLISAISLTLFLSATAVYYSQAWLLIPIVFSKAFIYAFVCAGVLASWGSAGWLLQLLLIFSDTMMLPVLWLFWLRACRQAGKSAISGIIPAVSAGFLICSIDLRFISPFLTDLLSL